MKKVLVLVAGMLLGAPALTDDTVNDPWEGWNRNVFAFNETLDKYTLKPLAKGYQAVTPDPVETGISNIFSNLGELLNIANDLLQGKVSQAGNDTGRFLLNSTVGIAGIFDVAEDVGLEKSDGEDFDQTLATWGVGSGNYLVLPLFGPSTLRGAPSLFVDSLANPVGYVDHVPTRNSLYGTDLISMRAGLLDAEELVNGDRYTFIRDVYLQRRKFLINDGDVEDDFGGYGEDGYDEDY